MPEVNVEQLIALLLPYLVQGGAQLVKDITVAIEGTPQQQGELDDAYIARIKAQVATTGNQILKEDAAAEASEAPASPTAP